MPSAALTVQKHNSKINRTNIDFMAETSWCLVGLAEPLQMQSHDRCKDILPLIPAGTKSGHSRWTDDECRLRKRPGSPAILILAVQGIFPSGDEIVTQWLSLRE
jgi:hypothetical protein